MVVIHHVTIVVLEHKSLHIFAKGFLANIFLELQLYGLYLGWVKIEKLG